jgi:hypothetical protein
VDGRLFRAIATVVVAAAARLAIAGEIAPRRGGGHFGGGRFPRREAAVAHLHVGVDWRAGGEQRLDDVDVAVKRRRVQRRRAGAIDHIGARASGNQTAHGVDATALGGVVQRREADRRGDIGVGLGGDQRLDNVVVAVLERHVQRGEALLVDGVDQRAALEQILHHLGLAVQRGVVKRRRLKLVARQHVGLVFDQRANNAEVAGDGAGVQRRGALRVGGANIGATLE